MSAWLDGGDVKQAQRPTYRRTFIRDWRKAIGLSQDQVVEIVREDIPDFSKASLSRIENGKQPYTQTTLEALARALRCDPGDMLNRRPEIPDMPWSVWERMNERERRQAVNVIKAIKEP